MKMGFRNENRVRFQIHLIYKCNLKCKYCNEFMDLLNWDGDETSITLEDLKRGADIIKSKRIQTNKLRIVGGEPTMHMHLKECLELIVKEWLGNRKIVSSNGILPVPNVKGIRYKYSPIGGRRKMNHLPVMISPFDLGIEPKIGFEDPCGQSRYCGRSFDTYGFSPCPNAGPMGRLFGIDPYHSEPVLLGMREMCQHCIYSVGKKVMHKLMREVIEGKINYPTKSYKEGLKRQLDKPTFFKKFRERVN